MTILIYLCIINIGNESHKWWLPHIVVTTHLPTKAKMCCFIYSLFVQIMYIIVNKATFIVIEIINPIVRNSKNSTINTTSLSHSPKLWSKVATHLLILISYVKNYTTYFAINQANIVKFYNFFRYKKQPTNFIVRKLL